LSTAYDYLLVNNETRDSSYLDDELLLDELDEDDDEELEDEELLELLDDDDDEEEEDELEACQSSGCHSHLFIL
jgi:ribonuclease E